MRALARLSSILALTMVLFLACTASRPARIPELGSPLVQLAELPDAADDQAFSRSCAMRLRDENTGREYLLVKSEIQTAKSSQGATETTVLASAVGDYARITAEPQARPVAELRVDCTNSRVVAVLAPEA